MRRKGEKEKRGNGEMEKRGNGEMEKRETRRIYPIISPTWISNPCHPGVRNALIIPDQRRRFGDAGKWRNGEKGKRRNGESTP
jgi:hypothetical protein